MIGLLGMVNLYVKKNNINLDREIAVIDDQIKRESQIIRIYGINYTKYSSPEFLEKLASYATKQDNSKYKIITTKSFKQVSKISKIFDNSKYSQKRE